MDAELEGVFDRADELLSELQEEYQRCVAIQRVSERAKNLFHEVLIKIRSALDMTMFRVWEKYGEPNLSEAKRRHAEKRSYFPIFDNQRAFLRCVRELGLSSLPQTNKRLYEAIERAQPWSTKRPDLRHLRELANLAKHVRLVPQLAKGRPARMAAGPQGTVVFTGGVEFHAEQIMGAPVNPETHHPMPTEDVNVRDVTWVSFVVEGHDIVDPVVLCMCLCQDTRSFVDRLTGFL